MKTTIFMLAAVLAAGHVRPQTVVGQRSQETIRFMRLDSIEKALPQEPASSREHGQAIKNIFNRNPAIERPGTTGGGTGTGAGGSGGTSPGAEGNQGPGPSGPVGSSALPRRLNP